MGVREIHYVPAPAGTASIFLMTEIIYHQKSMSLMPRMLRCAYIEITSSIPPHHDNLFHTAMTFKHYISLTKRAKESYSGTVSDSYVHGPGHCSHYYRCLREGKKILLLPFPEGQLLLELFKPTLVWSLPTDTLQKRLRTKMVCTTALSGCFMIGPATKLTDGET